MQKFYYFCRYLTNHKHKHIYTPPQIQRNKTTIAMRKFHLILLCTALLGSLAAMAVPARRDIVTVTQPDGTTLQIKKVGDERLHFTLTADDEIVVKGDDGFYYYGTVDDAQCVVSTGTRAGARQSTAAMKIQDVDIDRMLEVRAASPTFRAPSNVRRASSSETLPQSGLGLFQSSFPSTGFIKTAVVLVEYQDVKFTVSDPAAYYDKFFHETGFSLDGGTGCVTEYFTANSKNQFVPQFDVYGPITLKNNRVYYGGNDSSGNDKKPEQMVVEACDSLDSTVDFSIYDMNNDGLIDNVYIIYAGVGEASSDVAESVWPHQYDVRSAGVSKYYDGKKLAAYGCCNEWVTYKTDDYVDGIGTFVHEFSHVLGLPDLYSTSYGSYAAKTPGAWSCLDYGPYNNNGRTPPAYSVFERNAMGWITPHLLDSPESITLDYIYDSNEGCIIQTDKTNEFYLLENRQQEGWDKFVPGHGMLVWHIDYNSSIWTKNTVNNSAHQYVDIIEANNNPNNYDDTAMAGYPYPGTAKNTSLTSETTPALTTWAGNAIDVPITHITEDDGKIKFNVLGGRLLDTPEPKVEDRGSDYFEVAWEPVEDATDYLVTVKYATDPTYAETVVCDMGDDYGFKLPDGWTSSGTTTYSADAYCGAAAPAYKMNTDAGYLRSPVFESDISGLTFWMRLCSISGTYTHSSMIVYGYIDGTWTTIDTIVPEDGVAKTYDLSDKLPMNMRGVGFVMKKANGVFSLDDVAVTTSGSVVKTLDGYDAHSTGGATKLRVSGLVDGINKYYVTVRATADPLKSLDSDALSVEIGATGVDNIAIDNATDTAPVYYNLSGVRVDASRLTPGIYVKVAAGTASKVVVVK